MQGKSVMDAMMGGQPAQPQGQGMQAPMMGQPMDPAAIAQNLAKMGMPEAAQAVMAMTSPQPQQQPAMPGGPVA